jgi:hypothetical protein
MTVAEIGTGGHRERALESLSASPSRLRLPLLLITGLYVALCVWVHAGRSWQGDEWGSYLAFRDSYHHLLTHFGGWQTMNFYLAGLKAIHDARGGANWLLVLPGIAAGAWLVWLAAGLAVRLGSGREGAIVAALLIAVNPFLVSYSVTIRSYIFLAAFSAAMILALHSWRRTGRWRDGVLSAVCGALALLAHLNAVYTYVVVAVLAVCWTVVRVRLGHDEPLRRLWRLALPVAALGAVAGAAYIPQLADIATFRGRWSDTPPIALTFVPSVFSRFFGVGYVLLPALLMLLYASWRACRDRRESQWMLLAVVVAVGSISLAGVSHFPWAYSRFLIATLPWLLLLIADGCAVLALRSRMAAIAIVVVLSACSLFALSAHRQSLHAHPWQRIAQSLRGDLAAGDRCVLLGSVVFNTALRVHGVPCQYDAATVLASLRADEPARLTIVVIPSDIVIALPAQVFGAIRVITMAGNPRAIAARLSQALITGANDRVLGELADVYQQVGNLLRWIGPPDSAGKYDRLLNESRVRGNRFRNQPPQFFKSAGSSSGR